MKSLNEKSVGFYSSQGIGIWGPHVMRRMEKVMSDGGAGGDHDAHHHH